MLHDSPSPHPCHLITVASCLICRFLSRESTFQSDSEDEDVALYHLQRKQRRKWKRRSAGGWEERPVIQGLWVREVDWLKSAESSSAIIPPPPQFTDSVSQPCSPAELRWEEGCSCTDVCECVTGQSADTDDCDLDQDSESESDSESDPPAPADSTFDLMQVSSASDVRWSDYGGSLRSLLGRSRSTSADGGNQPECVFGLDDLNLPDALVDLLQGRVMQMGKTAASPLFKDLIKRTLSGWRSSKQPHEGLIFHHVRRRKTTPPIRSAPVLNFSSFCASFIVKQLHPSGGQYREGEEYCILHHIQNGSYGDVFCVRDAATGFTCAAKRVR